MWKKLKLQNRMFVIVIGISLVMLIVIFGIYYGFTKRILVTQNQEKAIEKVSGVAATLEGYFKGKAKIAWTYCHNPYLKNWLETNRQRGADHSRDPVYQNIIAHFKALVKNDTQIKAAFLASEATQEYYEDAERQLPDDYYVGNRPWYQKMVKLGVPHFNCDVDLLDQKVYLNYLFPIYSDHGKLLGCGGVDISLENLEAFLSRVDVFDSDITFLLGKDGTFIYHPDNELVLNKKMTDFQDDGERFRNIADLVEMMKHQDSGIMRVVFDGMERYFLFTQLPDLGWTLVLSIARDEIQAPLRNLAGTSLIIALSIGGFLSLVVIVVTGSISRPINRLAAMIKDVAQGEGDLTKRIRVDGEDEIGELAEWFNIFMDKLHDIIIQVRFNIAEVTRAAEVMSSSSIQVARTAEHQNAKTISVATSVQQITAAIVESSQSANQTSKIFEEAHKKAQSGSEAMDITRQSMENIVSSAMKTGAIVDCLSARAEQIDEVIRVIDDIADQTNLLALNAAIEAARAGEQGRGFAVVADEVRKLAERTTKATREIADTINAIQGDTKEVTASMAEVRAVVNDGRDALVKTEEILNEIVRIVMEAMDRIHQIAAASEQQSLGAEEISSNIEAISGSTHQTASSVEEMAATAEQLKLQTEALRKVVDRFKLRQDLRTDPAEDGVQVKRAVHDGGVGRVVVGDKGNLVG